MNIKIPTRVHRLTKAAAVLAGLTWDEVATIAFEEWARSRQAEAKR